MSVPGGYGAGMATTAPYITPDELITGTAFAARMGLTRAMIWKLRRKHGAAFPAPLLRVGDSHLYLADECRDWALAHGHRWIEPAKTT